MQIFFVIAYFIVGIVQWVAIVDGIGYSLNLGKFVSFIIAAFITYIPLVGSVAGVYGAVHVWDWSYAQALTLFFWYIPVAILLSGYSALARR
ncbi:hypothetical protein F3X89_17415 [Rhizobium rhizogenes]|uniref:hypothetical protein n=1 Tax=Rhizobium rhizogenes TaxID=359 RepID=UPI00193D31F6|nr:hypothetical protein [Rhizobium rhizogenes]QRM39473.1 hypothetical protein F3X89_17415 [Rhizobium rhizogenes]